MRKIQNLLKSLKLRKNSANTFNKDYREILIKAMGIIGILVLGSFAGINYYIKDMFPAVLETVLFIVLSFAFIYYLKTRSLNIPAHIGVIVMFIMTINNFIAGGFDKTGHYWSFLFPVVVFLLVGVSNGFYYTMLLYFIFFSLNLYQVFGYMELAYSNLQNFMFGLSFAVVSLLIMIYQWVNERIKRELTSKTETIKMVNQDLKQSIKNMQLSDQKLSQNISTLEEKNLLLENAEAAIMNVFEDVEEEKTKTFEEKERLNTILHSIGDGVIVLDANEIIIMVNETVELITGFKPDDLVGFKLREKLLFVSEKTRELNYSFIDNVFKKNIVCEIEKGTLLIKKDKSEMPVGDASSPIRNPSGKVTGCVIIFRDISKEREIDKMKSEFVSVASHQLRTPLTGIKWYLELMKDENYKNFSPEQKEYLMRMEESSIRMTKLVDDLLKVSRIESGRKFSIIKKTEDIVKIIKEVVRDQEFYSEKKKIDVILDDSLPKKLVLDIDEEKIRQVFKNLLNNALKYSPEKSRVKISYSFKDNKHIFAIKDYGIGIPKNNQKEIFKKFFRAENVTKLEVEGTGLGLYITRAIIEGHEGTVWFETKMQKGTTFYFSLPNK